MKIEDIRAAIVIGKDGTLRITPATLNSASITWLLNSYFPGGTLMLLGASIASQPTDDFVQVNGRAQVLGVETQASVKLSIEGGNAELELTGGLPGGYHLGDSFPSLRSSHFNDFVLDHPQVILTSKASAPGGRGLFLRAGFQLPTAWEVLRWFADPGAAATLSGPISLDAGEPVMRLEVSPRIQASLGGSLSVGLQMVHESRTFPSSDAPEKRSVTTLSELEGSIAFTHDSQQVQVPLAAYFTTDLSVLHLRMNTAQVFDVALGELAQWFGGTDPGTQGLPDTYRPAAGLTLHDVDFAIGLVSRRLESVSVRLESEAPWTLIPDQVEIDGIDILLTVLTPTSSPQVLSTLNGTLRMAGVEIEVHASLPGFELTGRLADGSTIDLSPLIEHHVGASRGVPDTLKISTLDFQASPSDGSYSLSVVVDGNWSVVPGVTLTDLSLTVGYGRLGGVVDVSASFEGYFTLGGVSLWVTADYDGETAGWQFEGGTGPSQSIPIGTLIQELVTAFHVDATLPASIAGAVIDSLHVSFNTASRAFTFTGEAKLEVEAGKEVDLSVGIDVTPIEGGYRKTFHGTLKIGQLRFDLVFDRDPGVARFVASYQDAAGGEVNLGDVLSAVTSQQELIALAHALTFTLKDALFAYAHPADAASHFVLGADLGGGIDLSHLPLVGAVMPSNQALRLCFQPLFASQPFSKQEVSALQGLIPTGGLSLPEGDLEKGLNLSTVMRIGDTVLDLSLPVKVDSTSGQLVDNPSAPPAPPPSGSTPAPDGVTWLPLQKSFGPVHFERIGVRYQGGQLSFLLDASLSAAGLTLSLDGLSASIALSDLSARRFDPSFALRGLSVDYQGGPVSIGGALLRQTVTDSGGGSHDEYDGGATVKTDALTLSALGSYTQLDGHPSLFVYALLDYPLGGPAFFFVTGLALAFGYNRSLRLPTIDQLAEFPLITEALSGTGGAKDAQAELGKLKDYLPPSTGSAFLAVGVKFTSFKIIDSFALLAASFGGPFALDLIGLSTLIAPSPVKGESATPLAVVQMAWRASFRPDEGLLAVQAQLTPASFILSRDCHLTGGYAFYSWFAGEHAGDFVQTLGGYHPAFKAPDHYPVVPRLGFNWQVDSDITIKGDAYYALTASCLMAGGHLEATWESGPFKAWFKAGADFLVSWRPYHYDAAIYVDLGASYTFHFFGTHHISVDLGAHVHIWGPEFSGKAHVDLSIVSFTVSFGAGASNAPQPIDWSTFRSSFLPADADITSVSIQRGLVRSIERDGETEWIVNAKELSLVTNSVVPSKHAMLGADAGGEVQGSWETRFGIGPMALTQDKVSSQHTLVITRDDLPAETEFQLTPVTKRVPAGLWGQSLQPGLNAPRYIEGALAGFEITPKALPKPGETAPISRDRMQFATETVPAAFGWTQAGHFAANPGDDSARREAVRHGLASPAVLAVRGELLQALGLSDEPDVNGSIADELLFAPQVGTWTT